VDRDAPSVAVQGQTKASVAQGDATHKGNEYGNTAKTISEPDTISRGIAEDSMRKDWNTKLSKPHRPRRRSAAIGHGIARAVETAMQGWNLPAKTCDSAQSSVKALSNGSRSHLRIPLDVQQQQEQEGHRTLLKLDGDGDLTQRDAKAAPG